MGAYSRLGAYEKAPKNVKLGSLRPSCATMAKKFTKEMHMQSCCFANLNLFVNFLPLLFAVTVVIAEAPLSVN